MKKKKRVKENARVCAAYLSPCNKRKVLRTRSNGATFSTQEELPSAALLLLLLRKHSKASAQRRRHRRRR